MQKGARETSKLVSFSEHRASSSPARVHASPGLLLTKHDKPLSQRGPLRALLRVRAQKQAGPTESLQYSLDPEPIEAELVQESAKLRQL